MKKIAIINPIFSSESGPPVILCDIAKIKGYMKGVDTRCYDLDVEYFNMLNQEEETYDLVQYSLGGFPFTFPYSAVLASNQFPFEELLAGDVLLAILYGGDLEEPLQGICNILGLDYKIVFHELCRFLEFIDQEINKFIEYEEFIFYCNSISSVVTTLILAKELKKHDVKIVGIGKCILVPYIQQFIKETGLIDIFLNNYEELKQYYDLKKPDPNLFDFSDVDSKQYYSKSGLSNLELNLCKGCPGKCKFCSIRLDWNENEIVDRYEILPLSQVKRQLQQIEDYFISANIHINDCTFNAYEPYTLSLLEEMEHFPFLYSCNLRADKISEDIVVAMEKAHVYQVIVGIESLNSKSVRLMNKGETDYCDKVHKTIKQLLDHKVCPQMNALIFYPEEKQEDVSESIRLWRELKEECKENGFDYFYAPVGTLCINYPSEMYYNVIKSNDYEIIFHKVKDKIRGNIPEKVREKYEKIPFYAVKHQNSGEKIVNKMQYVKEIVMLNNSNSQFRFQCTLNSATKVAEQMKNAWQNKYLKIILTDTLKKFTSQDKVFQYLKECLEEKSVYEVREIFRPLSPFETNKMILLILALSYRSIILLK